MIVNGREIIMDDKDIKKAIDIQQQINKIRDVPEDLKRTASKEDIKDVIDGIDTFNMSMMDEFTDDDSLQTRREMYETYREMARLDVINKALEIIADDSCQKNQDGKVLTIYSDDETIKKRLEELFFDRLDYNNELWSTIYDTCQLGDNFYEVVVDSLDHPKKIMALKYLEPEKTERVEMDGRLAYFTYRVDGKKIRKKDIKEVIYKLQPWQVIHFRMEDKTTMPYGNSLLKAGIRTYKRIVLLEDISLVYRISRAPERRVFYVDVGQLNNLEAGRFLKKFRDNYRTQNFIDENGKINKKANMMSITQDIFIPTREGNPGTKIDVLQGGTALGGQDDLLKYFKDKLVRMLNIPPAYLGDDSDRSKGCLHPNTLIELADGRSVSIAQLAQEYKEGKVNYVFSILNGDWVIKPIAWAGITKTNTETLKVTLDNGENIICTPNHLFMTRDGNYKKAEELIVGESFTQLKEQAINHKVVSVEPAGLQEAVYDLTIDEETPNFALSCGIVVHNSLGVQDVKFSKFVERIQSHIIKPLNKLATLELFFAGFTKEDLMNFSIELTPSSNIREITDLEFINQKMMLIQTMMGLNIFPLHYILKKVLRMTDKEIANIQLYKKLETQNVPEPGMEGMPAGTMPMDTGMATMPTVPEMPGEAPEAAAAAALPAPEATPAPMEGALVSVFGKDFLIENKKDFLKMSKYIQMNEEIMKDTSKSSSYLMEEISNILLHKNSRDRTSKNVNRLKIMNEFGGINFNEKTMSLFEEKKTKSKEPLYEEITVKI